MRWFGKKKDKKDAKPKKTKKKKPIAVKILEGFHSLGGTPVPPSVLEHYGSTNSFKQNRHIQKDLTDEFLVIKKSLTFYSLANIYELVVVQKKLYIKKEYVTNVRHLSDVDIQNWLGSCGATYNGLTWRQVTTEGTSCHSVSPENLYPIIHNLFDGNFFKCQSTGKFTTDELRQIFPDYDRELREQEDEAKRRQLEAQEMAREQAEQAELDRYMKKIERGEQMDERLEYEVKKKITMHNLDKKLNPEKEVEKPKKSKPTYDESSRLGNIGIILDENFENTDHLYKFDLDKQGVRHTVIIGGVGSGKSITGFDVVEEGLLNGIPVLALDPTGQWSGFFKPNDNESMCARFGEFRMGDPSFWNGNVYVPPTDAGLPLKANLLAKPSTDDESVLSGYADELSDIIKIFCGLSTNETVEVRTLIFNSWNSGHSLDYRSVISDDFTSISLKNKLASLLSTKFLFEGENITDFGSEFLKEGEISVISLNEIVTENVEMFVSYYVLRQMVDFFDREPDSDKLKMLLVVDEFHRFRGVALDMLNRICRTLRKKGVGCIFVSQVLVDLPRDIRANTSTKIYMKTLYNNDIERAKQDIGELAEKLGSLQTGVGIVSYSGNSDIVKFRPCYCSHQMMNLDEIRKKYH